MEDLKQQLMPDWCQKNSIERLFCDVKNEEGWINISINSSTSIESALVSFEKECLEAIKSLKCKISHLILAEIIKFFRAQTNANSEKFLVCTPPLFRSIKKGMKTLYLFTEIIKDVDDLSFCNTLDVTERDFVWVNTLGHDFFKQAIVMADLSSLVIEFTEPVFSQSISINQKIFQAYTLIKIKDVDKISKIWFFDRDLKAFVDPEIKKQMFVN